MNPKEEFSDNWHELKCIILNISIYKILEINKLVHNKTNPSTKY
jgi:hypothetical protein